MSLKYEPFTLNQAVATAYNNIAGVYSKQGKHEEARALLEMVEFLKKLEAMKRRS